MPERLDTTVTLPQLHVITVHESLGILFRDFIVRTCELD
jgi:hypothetical protein